MVGIATNGFINFVDICIEILFDSGNENIVSALIQHGANVNHTEKDTEGGKAPLYFAALYGNA